MQNLQIFLLPIFCIQSRMYYSFEFFYKCAKTNNLLFYFCFYFTAQKMGLWTESFMTSMIQSRWCVILANMVVSPHLPGILSPDPELTVPMRTCWWLPRLNVRGPPLSPCNIRNYDMINNTTRQGDCLLKLSYITATFSPIHKSRTENLPIYWKETTTDISRITCRNIQLS